MSIQSEKPSSAAQKNAPESDAARGPAEADSGDDAHLLRRLLADQRAATIRARADALHLQNALAEVQEKLNGKKSRTAAIPARLEDAHRGLRPDAVLVKAQWERAQRDLQRSLAAGIRDSEQASARRNAVADALRIATETATLQMLHSKRRFRFRILVGAGAAAVLLSLLLFTISPRESRERSSGLSIQPARWAATGSSGAPAR